MSLEPEALLETSDSLLCDSDDRDPLDRESLESDRLDSESLDSEDWLDSDALESLLSDALWLCDDSERSELDPDSLD